MFCKIDEEGEGQYTVTLYTDMGREVLCAELLPGMAEAWDAMISMMPSSENQK